MNGAEDRPGRETRLLLLVLFVAITVLLILARVRFPETELAAPVSPGSNPLDRLAARTTYDDLGDSVATLVGRVSAAFVSIEIEPLQPASKSATARAAHEAGADRRPELAMRVRADLAVLYLPAGMRVSGDPAAVVAADPTRGVVLVRVPPAAGAFESLPAAEAFAGFRYVAVFTAALGGPSAQPAFIGRVDTVAAPGWPALVVPGGEPRLTRGGIVVGLDGRLVGLAIAHGDGVALVSPAALDAAVREMAGPDGR